MSILASMNIAQQALVVNEAALSVVSNNIANIDTDGYSRQRVILSPGVNYTPIGGAAQNQVYSTTGVTLDGVERYTDSYLLSYFRQQTSTNAYLQQSSDIATSVQDVMNELKGTGLEAAFSKFYEAAQALSLNPADSSVRQNYIQQAQSVALKFNDISTDLTELRTSLVGDGMQSTLDASKITGLTTQANTLIERLAQINSDVVKVGSGELMPNSLLDTRDQIINQLTELIPITIKENTNGTVNLSMNGLDLVNGTKLVGKLGLTTGDANNPAVIQLKDADGNITMPNINNSINSGTIGAVLDMCGPSIDNSLTIPDVLGDLNQLASGFAGIINNLQLNADADGTPMAINQATKTLILADEAIFESNGGGPITAANIKINSDVLNNPYLVAVARVDILNYEATAIGNNSNMIKVLESRTTNSAALGNTSPEGYVANTVSSIGLKVSTINNQQKSQIAVLTQVETRLSSATGVNLNEELMDLTKYQTAYQASARVYSICNELLDVLINLGR